MFLVWDSILKVSGLIIVYGLLSSEPKAFYSDRARQNIKSDLRKTSTGDESEVENNLVKADRTPRIPDRGHPSGRQGTLIPRESGRALIQGYFLCTSLMYRTVDRFLHILQAIVFQI